MHESDLVNSIGKFRTAIKTVVDIEELPVSEKRKVQYDDLLKQLKELVPRIYPSAD